MSAQVSEIGTVGATGSPTLTVTGGLAHSCIAASNGIQCWGSDTNGQLGDDSTTLRTHPVPVTGIVFGTTAVSAGSTHTCAVVNGAARCWGNNSAGQLGNGQPDHDTTIGPDSHVPVGVTNLSAGVQAIAAGDLHTCAMVNGAAQCWGSNNFGQVGDNTVTLRRSPVAVNSLGSGVQAIAAGGAHTCAIVNGAAMCWGLNNTGQLGNAPVGSPPTGDSHIPVLVTGLGSGVIAIAAGENHTCAIVTGGAVKCWGSNSKGQLGNNASGGFAATPVAVAGLDSGAIAIAAGQNHTCAIAAGGAAKCWGANDAGQVGNGSTNQNDPLPPDSNAPAQVAGLTSGVQAIATGAQHSCATTTSGGVFCWGLNSSAQIAVDPNAPDGGLVFGAPRAIPGLVLGGCADGTDEQVFNNGMVGCAGKVGFSARNTLCAAGYRAATALQWSTNRGAGIPAHHYWTNDPLLVGGSGSTACFVSMSVGNSCGADTPMRVCAVNNTDPEGNLCSWTQCGLYTFANQYFGGCGAGNPTAGTVCIPISAPSSACSQYSSCPLWENGFVAPTNTESTGIVGNTVSCTQFCAGAGQCNPAACGDMTQPTAACENAVANRRSQLQASITSLIGSEANFDNPGALAARSSAALATISVSEGYHIQTSDFSQTCKLADDPTEGIIVGGGGGGGGGGGCTLFWNARVVCDLIVRAPVATTAPNDACGCAN